MRWPRAPSSSGRPCSVGSSASRGRDIPNFGVCARRLATCTPTSSASRAIIAVHFDLGVDDVAAAAARLVAIGATQVSDFGIWRVMRSPGGLAFCLVPGGGESVPAPSVWPNGHRSRLVQLCIDSPAGLHDAEVAFWRAATGWRYEPSALEEYGGKLFPPSPAPVRLLFQRLGDDDHATATRVHIDLGTDDIPAEVDRVEALGAQRRYEGDGWVQLVDPNGLPFCVTRSRRTR